MLKKILIIILIVGMLMLVTAVAGIYIIAEDKPLVAENNLLKEADHEILAQLVRENRPGAVVQSGLKNLSLTPVQLNQLLQYASEKEYPGLSSYVTPETNRLNLNLSYKLPANPVGKYLNVKAAVRVQFSKYFVIEQLKVGKLTIPPVLVTILRPIVIDEFSKNHAAYVGLWEYLRRIDLSKEGVVIHYRLERSDLRHVNDASRKIMINTEDRNHVKLYTAELSRILSSLPSEKQTVIHVLQPMFLFAKQQTEKSKNAVAENKMTLLVLGVYFSGKNPELLIEDKPEHLLKRINFTLSERVDLAQHYIISSAINALAGTRWANTVGLEKEFKDSQSTNGFSFVDLMADIAGNKLAQTALEAQKAEKLQKIMAELSNEQMIFGRINGLEEGLSEDDFRLEYGTTNSDEYMTVIRDIERRLFRSEAYR